MALSQPISERTWLVRPGECSSAGTSAPPARSTSSNRIRKTEAGTYFSGRAKFQNGTARIPVPEHFRIVTNAEGLTVQITPIGAMPNFAVMKMDLNDIVVQASRNVEFSYLVQGFARVSKT